MTPSLAVGDATHLWSLDTKLICKSKKRLAGRTALSNLKDLCTRQLSASIDFTPRISTALAFFTNHVRNVICLCSSEQVIRIDAGWIIAPVQGFFTRY